ncbi:MAG: PstS family phosphate ABC transporter substrate-binding protein [Chitinophagales bacterium]
MKQILLATSVVALLFSSCGGSKSESGSKQLSGSVSIDGSSTVFPISEAVAEEFKGVHPKVNITVAESGTGGGFKKFGRGEIDICGASRPIKDSERAACDSAGIKFLEIEVAYDGLAVVVNKDNSWVDKLTVAELKMIWQPEAQGTLTNWNQVRPEFPSEPIHLYGPGTASGTFDYFTEEICGKKGNSRGDYTANENDNVLVTGVAGDKGGLGYFGMAYYEKNMDKLKIVPVDNDNGGVLPTKETVLNKSYSPLSRPLYIYVSEKAMEKPEVAVFMHYYLDNAKILSEEVGYVALSDAEYEAQKKKLPAPVVSEK